MKPIIVQSSASIPVAHIKKEQLVITFFFLIQTNSYRYQDPIIRCLSKATKFKATQMFWESHVASGHEK